MEVLEAVKSRRSIRKYKSVPIPEDKLQRVLNAARLAPSAANMQPWEFIVIMDEDVKRKLAMACSNMPWITRAPVVIVALANMDSALAMIGGYMNSAPVDVAISLDHLSLAAVSEGLGTCWIGAFREEKVQEALDIPSGRRVVSIMTLGYPDESPGPTGRKHLSEIVSYDKYEE
jgi:nitroreductase